MSARRRGTSVGWAVLLLTTAVTAAPALAGAGDGQELAGNDLSAWRGDTGAWLVAGAATPVVRAMTGD